ncbi:hypothetical protein Psi01_21040 [Planobispora siamensis]|uniref:Uncharacterized protein n=1 Tax=Planobispora siamensis TaxID=936338 RepID=A0A8J3WI82_9ACTN|nr:hypothetical protein Psi01_21040 [Planobispora siamensis]
MRISYGTVEESGSNELALGSGVAVGIALCDGWVLGNTTSGSVAVSDGTTGGGWTGAVVAGGGGGAVVAGAVVAGAVVAGGFAAEVFVGVTVTVAVTVTWSVEVLVGAGFGSSGLWVIVTVTTGVGSHSAAGSTSHPGMEEGSAMTALVEASAWPEPASAPAAIVIMPLRPRERATAETAATRRDLVTDASVKSRTSQVEEILVR